MNLLRKPIAVVLLAAAGVAILVIGKILHPAPQRLDSSPRPLAAEVMPIRITEVQPQVSGYGIVRPATSLQLLAEVSGRVLYKHPDLQAGALLGANTELLRLDDTDYQLALQQARANLAIAESQLTQLALNEQNLQRSLELSNQRLQSSRQELARKQTLASAGSLSASQLEAEQRLLLQAEQEQLNLQQQLAVVPSQRDLLKAQRAAAEAQQQQQQRNIERTHIRLPVNARISQADPDVGQFVGNGQLLVKASGTEAAEIEAHFTLEQLRRFMQTLLADGQEVPPQLANADSPGLIRNLLANSQLHASVSLPMLNHQGQWAAGVVAIREAVDPQSHTLAVRVRIDSPYHNLVPGQRPPLLEGLQARVTLIGRAIRAIEIPANALHHGAPGESVLYLLDDQQRLRRQPVEVRLPMADRLLLAADALPENSTLILSDLVPAIDGMAITPVPVNPPDPDRSTATDSVPLSTDSNGASQHEQ